MFKCSLCLGFWSGVIVAGIQFLHVGEILILLPFASAGASWFADHAIGAVIAIEQSNNKDSFWPKKNILSFLFLK